MSFRGQSGYNKLLGVKVFAMRLSRVDVNSSPNVSEDSFWNWLKGRVTPKQFSEMSRYAYEIDKEDSPNKDNETVAIDANSNSFSDNLPRPLDNASITTHKGFTIPYKTISFYSWNRPN